VTSLDSTAANCKVPLPTDFGSDRLVSPKVAAQLLNISLPTLRRMWERGEGPRRLRVSPRRDGCRLKDIAAYLDRCGGSAS
jgi:predicted DNA-binding transcriptional regulator AlpA